MPRLRPLTIALSALALAAWAPAAHADTGAGPGSGCDSSTQSAGDAQVTQQVCGRDVHTNAGQFFDGKIGTLSVTSSAGDDPLSNGLYPGTIYVDWGDGTIDQSAFAFGGEIDGYHTYSAAGTYDVKVAVTTSGTYHGADLALTNFGESTWTVGPPGPAYVTWNVRPASHPGQDFAVKAIARNPDGSVDTSYNDPSPTWGDSWGVLSPATPAPFVNGVSTTTAHFIAPAHGDFMYLDTNGADVGTRGFNVVGPLDHFSIGHPASARTGQAFTVTVSAKDAVGNTVPGYAGSASLSDDTGTLAATLGSFAKGVATATDAEIAQGAKTDHITATDGSITGQSSAFRVVGGVDHFAVSVKPPVAPNQDTTVTVRALDANGAVVSDYAGSPTFSDSDGLLSGTPAPFVNGVSTSTHEQFSAPAKGDHVTVTDGSATGTSNAFNVVGPVDHFGIGVASTVPVGEDFRVGLRALDAAGNTVKSYSDRPYITDDANRLTATQTPTFAAGVATMTDALIPDLRPGDHLTVSDPDVGATTTSRAFDVVESIDHYTFTSAPSYVHQQTPFGVTIEARDANDHLVTAYNGIAQVTDARGGFPYPTDVVFENGVGSVSGLQIWNGGESPDGPDQLVVSDGAATGHSGDVTVRGSLEYLTVSVKPTGTTGHDFIVTATANDTDAQTITDYTGTPHLTDSAGLLSQDASPAVDGVSVTQVHIDGTAASDTITAVDGSSYPSPSAAFSVPFS